MADLFLLSIKGEKMPNARLKGPVNTQNSYGANDQCRKTND